MALELSCTSGQSNLAKKLLWTFSLRPTPLMSRRDFCHSLSRNFAVVGL